jgi:FHS family glucose/mannose:H+ symporter-like MFS transporter
MNNLRAKIALVYNFILPALLLNSVAIVILKMVNIYHVSPSSAGWLEAFKDFSIVGGSFLLASFIPRMGYKKAILLATLLEAGACALMASIPSFITARVFFVMIGVSFALIKIAVYSSISIFTDDANQHASFLTFIEGLFMVGILCVFWIFGIFMKIGNWTHAFWFLAMLAILGFILMLCNPLDESKLTNDLNESSDPKNWKQMLKLLTSSVVLFFVIMAFAYVFVEQAITTWLPTYDNHVLHIQGYLSVEIASLLSAAIAIGRLSSTVVMKYISWWKVLMVSIALALITLITAIYLSIGASHIHYSITSWHTLPFVAYLIPLVGIFIGPIYPTLCSSILSRQPLHLQSSMAGLIILFSALGGTIGSRITGTFFGFIGGFTAIEIPIIPLLLLFVMILPYYKRIRTSA